MAAIPGVVFSGSDDGHLRAFGAEDGRVLWDFDTARDYQTANGVRGKGGSLDGAGPVAAGGMLFVNLATLAIRGLRAMSCWHSGRGSREPSKVKSLLPCRGPSYSCCEPFHDLGKRSDDQPEE